ncbi:MAG TPA: hypothetical protein VFP66_11335 [Candidatus Limnocylindrales bacterium]|nr:hypothetical protein [Candidatus Limnocylindrales bacterium]
MPRRSKRWAVRATAPETAIPAAPIAMYVTGSQADPYVSRNMALATMPSNAAITPNATA